MDVNATGRVIHALAALRDSDGNVQVAAVNLGISKETLLRALAEVGPKFYEELGDGRILPTPMGLRFADRVGTFPYVNW